MKYTIFSNTKGNLTSDRTKNGNVFNTLGLNGKNYGFTVKMGRATFRYSNTGNLLGIGTKLNGRTMYSDPMGKKLVSLPAYDKD